jgi:serine carboxypeptidase-like clade 2
MNGDTTLSENPGRWNINANVLFIESPPGVGFSYIDKGVASLPYIANDTTTTADSLGALVDFFATYTMFNKSSLWLSGESYSGIYTPWLARAILQSSQNQLISQLKGVFVGNGALKTNDNYEGNLTQQRMQHAFNHGLFSTSLKQQIEMTCLNFTAPRTPACDALLQQQQDEIGPLNSYNIEVTCLGSPSSPQQRALLRSVDSNLHNNEKLSLNPCTAADTALTAYMNRPDVQSAMHFTQGASVIGAWGECQGGTVTYTRIPCDEMVDVYPILLQKIAVIIYNGDQDECIPYIQDEAWTSDMGLPIKTNWRPWLLDNQVAGYVVEYQAPVRFTFLTVKGAGHEVPMYSPLRALAMIQRVIAGNEL